MGNKDLQRSVFKKIMSNPENLPAALNKVSKDDFDIPIIKATIGALAVNGHSVHYSPNKQYFEILLREEIKDRDKREKWSELLCNFASEPTDNADLDILIKELKNNRMCDELTKIIRETIPEIQTDRIDGTYDTLLNKLMRLPLRASSATAIATVHEVGEDVEGRVRGYFDPHKAKFPTGISAFDKSIGGFAPGEFIVLSAGTGQGKSAVMLWWAEQFVQKGANVAYITIEMSYDETMERYNAMATGFKANDIRNKRVPSGQLHTYFEKLIAHSLDPSDQPMFLSGCQEIVERHNPEHALELSKKFNRKKGKLFVVDMPQHVTASKVEHQIRQLSMDDRIDYVFVDFLNVMDPEHRLRNDVKELSTIARDLKLVARKTRTVLFSACQLNTADLEKKGVGAIITTDDLKYAKAIGENSDWVIAFHRDPNDHLTKQVRLQLAKHRHGPASIAVLEFDFATFQVEDLGEASDLPDSPDDIGIHDRPKARAWKGRGYK